MFKKKTVKNSAKKLDKIITWMIVWTAVASMVGLSKTKKWKSITKKIFQKWWNVFKKSYNYFWKAMVGTINFFKKK